MTDAISTRARQMAADLRDRKPVNGVITTLELIADRHDALLAQMREIKRLEAQAAKGEKK